MALASVNWESGGRMVVDGWWRLCLWHVHHGTVELWRSENAGDTVRVSGDVPAAVLVIDPVPETKRPFRDRSRTRDALMDGVAAEVERHDVRFRLPRRGLLRRHRILQVTIDGVEYRYRPRSLGSSELVRPDGTPVVRVFAFRNDRLDDGATPIETTVAALCSLAELHDRVTRNVIYAVG